LCIHREVVRDARVSHVDSLKIQLASRYTSGHAVNVATKNLPRPTAETFAAMTEIAQPVAAASAVTINDWTSGTMTERKDWTFTPEVSVDESTGHITIYVPENRVLDLAASRELLISTRKAIVDAWTAAGFRYFFRRQRCKSDASGWTWVYLAGFWRMGSFDVSGRYAVLIPAT